MDEEEQFVNIDLNDDNVCSVCKLETDTGTMSFCHVCFDLSIEGVSHATLLHSKSLRGHRECFEKYHLIANQKLSRSKVSRSAYEGMKLALSQKISRIVQYAQNKDSVGLDGGLSRRGGKHQLICYSQNGDHKLLPQSDAQVPRYTPRCNQGTGTGGLPDYATSILECHSAQELDFLEDRPSLEGLWGTNGRRGLHHCSQSQSSGGDRQTLHSNNGLTREELNKMSVDELHQLNGKLLQQIQKVFEELTEAVQEKDSLTSELHVRHIAIEQLFKNCAKLPWLQISRAGSGVQASSNNPME
ncbi:protein EURL homolog [Esox lucius]|uniref:Protein EURL homolog n=1 Tax=Esox lucius TaxID=8010 RepID=A0A3P8Z7T1_ESOLU|nr:protein EURL homolog [Esox lucius]XP_010869035.1 protein EURL homolog [Esox lucius]XP_010869036.1 protein EURL homolog [Esox lucius]XP_010869037.1 protein EURL homolog [Esox lucius]XP_019903815.1 protein EURL homolog [Esox lucius]XP_019903816.1 protein EURL homolog [Esox lucius]XP_019903817.1 protein EURL homolog [Esox lucius]